MAPNSGRLDKIRAFRSMVERELSWNFNPDEFEDRLRMQKLVYLAGEFGLDHDYPYNMYLHGPYSPDLAKDYYKEDFMSAPGKTNLSSFELGTFLNLVDERDNKWLEVAATAHSLHESYSKDRSGSDLENSVVEATSDKKGVPADEVKAIYGELKARSVV